MKESLFSFNTPFTPPTTEDDELSWLRLIRSRRVGPTTFWRLLAEYGTAQAALNALPEIARDAGVQSYSICPEGVVMAELKAARKAGARLICAAQPTYPTSLSDIADAPPVLWAIGDTRLLNRPMVALVGARNASSLGTRMARKLAEGLVSAGYCVVSGLARGIDAAAHAAALPATIAVHAGGVDVIYPTENTALAEAIARDGLCLSEQPMGLEPMVRHFPTRNRIISGLAQAVVVVEAAGRSGSLITARNALDQGREVMAVSGHPFDARAGGCNQLIRDGAVLIRGPEDVLAALAATGRPDPVGPAVSVTTRPTADGTTTPQPQPQHMPQPQVRGVQATLALHNLILDRLGPSPLAEDQLIRDLARPCAEITEQLLTLELDGQIVRQAGGFLARVT